MNLRLSISLWWNHTHRSKPSRGENDASSQPQHFEASEARKRVQNRKSQLETGLVLLLRTKLSLSHSTTLPHHRYSPLITVDSNTCSLIWRSCVNPDLSFTDKAYKNLDPLRKKMATDQLFNRSSCTTVKPCLTTMIDCQSDE